MSFRWWPLRKLVGKTGRAVARDCFTYFFPPFNSLCTQKKGVGCRKFPADAIDLPSFGTELLSGIFSPILAVSAVLRFRRAVPDRRPSSDTELNRFGLFANYCNGFAFDYSIAGSFRIPRLLVQRSGGFRTLRYPPSLVHLHSSVVQLCTFSMVFGVYHPPPPPRHSPGLTATTCIFTVRALTVDGRVPFQLPSTHLKREILILPNDIQLNRR